MEIKRFFGVTLNFILIILITACGGGGSGDTINAGPNQGFFLDSAVSGMTYTSTSYSGTTDSSGAFNYATGETVTFSIGSIVIGSSIGGLILTPVSLVSAAVDETHPMVTNIARFLLTLDEDNDPNNGITISANTQAAAAAMSVNFDKSVNDFEIASDVVDAVNVLTGSSTLFDSAAAQSHLQSTILTAYAGNYSGTYSGSDSGNWQVSVASNGTLSGSGNDNMGGGFSITGTFTSGGTATLTQGGTSSGATFTGTVDFNGNLTGTWSGTNNSSGSFSGSKQ